MDRERRERDKRERRWSQGTLMNEYVYEYVVNMCGFVWCVCVCVCEQAKWPVYSINWSVRLTETELMMTMMTMIMMVMEEC